MLNPSSDVSHSLELVQYTEDSQQHLIISVLDNEEGARTFGEELEQIVLSDIGSDAFDKAIQNGFEIIDSKTKVVMPVPKDALELRPYQFDRFEEDRVAGGVAQ